MSVETVERHQVAIEPGRFREVLGHYPTGVCIVTAEHPTSGRVGMTVGSFTSVSVDPPLVAFLPAKDSRSFPLLAEIGRFCVNVLAADQQEVCRSFATRGADKFASAPWRTSPLGSPLLEGSVAWIDCKISSVNDAGDHWLVVARVHDLAIERPVTPLMFFQGGYGRFSARSLVLGMDELGAHLRLADLARPWLERVARDCQVETHATAVSGGQLIQLAWVGSGRADDGPGRVGVRLPNRPPIGALFVAWASKAEQEIWIARAASDDAVARSKYAAMLADTRDRGWVATPANDFMHRVESAVIRLAVNGHLPSHERALERELSTCSEAFGVADAPTHGISVPIFDASGCVVLSMGAQGLHRAGTTEPTACLAQLRDAAAALTAAIGGHLPSG